MSYTIVHTLSEEQKYQLLNLYQGEWWSKNRTQEDVNTIVENSSLIFAYIKQETGSLIGFARVLTDFYKYAYIYDVIVEATHRKLGLGKKIMESIVHHPKLNHIKCIELTCRNDMTPFYDQFGFSKDYGTTIPMRRLNSNSTKD
jgi:predicted GNAT family N-acyltransferase